MERKLFGSLLTFMMVAMLSFCFVSCGGNDKDDDLTQPPSLNEDNHSNEDVNDYTATTAIKTATLKNGYSDGGRFINEIIIYEDFNYKYSLWMSEGKLYLCVYKREDGSWHGYRDSNEVGYIDDNKESQNLTKTMTVGKVDNINSIKDKVSVSYSYPSGEPQTIQPNYGYAMAYTTENKVRKYLRVYIYEYSLDGNGSLNTIKMQYQVY